MSVRDLYDSARAVISQHNDVLESESPGQVNPDEFINCLKVLGYTTEDILLGLSFEKIASCLPEVEVRPGEKKPMLGLAESIRKAWRKGTESSPADSGKGYVSGKKADRMTVRELLEHFDPTEPESKVAKRLDEIAKGASFWVAGPGGVDVDLSAESLEVVKKFGPHKDGIFVKGKKRYETFKVGDQPDVTVQKNPVWPDRPLRGWICDQTNRSWEGVSEEVLQFIILGVDMGEIPQNVGSAHNLLDMALESNGFDRLKQRYGKVEVEFDRRKRKNDLPKTTMDLKPVVQEEAQSGRPFENPRKVVWQAPSGQTYGTFSNDPVVYWDMVYRHPQRRTM